MAHIIGLTVNDDTDSAQQIMVNADHIIYWTTLPGGSAVHLSDGTILRVREDTHTINERIDVIQAALETWIEE